MNEYWINEKLWNIPTSSNSSINSYSTLALGWRKTFMNDMKTIISQLGRNFQTHISSWGSQRLMVSCLYSLRTIFWEHKTHLETLFYQTQVKLLKLESKSFNFIIKPVEAKISNFRYQFWYAKSTFKSHVLKLM